MCGFDTMNQVENCKKHAASRSSSGRLQILAEVWCLPHRAADATRFTGRMVGPFHSFIRHTRWFPKHWWTRAPPIVSYGRPKWFGHVWLHLIEIFHHKKAAVSQRLCWHCGTMSARWQRRRWQGLFQRIQPLRSIEQGVLYETVTGAEVFCLREWLGVAVAAP